MSIFLASACTAMASNTPLKPVTHEVEDASCPSLTVKTTTFSVHPHATTPTNPYTHSPFPVKNALEDLSNVCSEVCLTWTWFPSIDPWSIATQIVPSSPSRTPPITPKSLKGLRNIRSRNRNLPISPAKFASVRLPHGHATDTSPLEEKLQTMYDIDRVREKTFCKTKHSYYFLDRSRV
jgi:hypothetical protein